MTGQVGTQAEQDEAEWLATFSSGGRIPAMETAVR